MVFYVFFQLNVVFWKRQEEIECRYPEHTDGVEKLNLVYWLIVYDILAAVFGKGLLHSSPELVGMFACHCSKNMRDLKLILKKKIP